MTTVTNKNGVEFDIDAIATDLNNKVDLDGTNATYPHIVSRTANSQGGVVEIWSDGYCVQTGNTALTTNPQTISLPQSFINTSYVITMTNGENDTDAAPVASSVYSKAVNSFVITSGYQGTFYSVNLGWRVEGYIR